MKYAIGWGLAASLAATLPTIAFAQTPLAISSADQGIEDYGREWRRARKMARACGASESYMSFVAFAEGVLIEMKADEQREHGKAVEEDATKYVTGFQDYLEVNSENCARHQAALAPIMAALESAITEKRDIQLYRAPAVACPPSKPC